MVHAVSMTPHAKYDTACTIDERIRRFAPSPVLVLDKFPHGERFFSPYGKNLSPCGKFNDIITKHKHCFIFVYTLVGGFTARERFLPYGEKNFSPCGNLSRTSTRLGAKRRTLYVLNFNIKNECFKILNPSRDG
jgi:hypothetical protein